MTGAIERRNLTIVVCGAPLAARVGDLVSQAQGGGWRTYVVATPSALAWLDRDEILRQSGHPMLTDYRVPGEPKRAPQVETVVVFPATFNTVNKCAAGMADTYALGLLCEAIGARAHVLMVPMINDKLWGHPALKPSLATLSSAGVVFLDPATGDDEARSVSSGSGGQTVADFDMTWITSRLTNPT